MKLDDAKNTCTIIINNKKFNLCDKIDDKDIKAIEIVLEELENITSKYKIKEKQLVEAVIEKDNKVLRFLLELKKELTEELKYNSTKKEARLQLSIVDKILEILKGEKK